MSPQHATCRQGTLLMIVAAGLLATACGAPQAGRRTVEKTPAQKAEYRYKLAAGLVHEGKPIAALKELDTALRLAPDHARSHYLKGFIFLGRRNYTEALIHVRRAIDLDPKLYEAQSALAGIYIALHRWREAIDASEPLLADSLYPSPWLAHNNAGWAWYQLGNTAKATHHLSQATFLKPGFCLGYYNLGIILKEQRRLEEARLNLLQARKNCPKHAQTHLELGGVHEAMGQLAEARAAYLECQEIATGSMLGERCRARAQHLPAPRRPRAGVPISGREARWQ